MNTTGKGFGKRLKKLRAAAGLTQAALGEKAGINPASIAQWELGLCHPREKAAAKLMAFFEGAKVTPADPPAPKRRGRPRKDQGGGAVKSPVRHGTVNGSWLDQQVESFAKARGYVFESGPVRIVVMNRPDVVALCKLMLEVGAVRVE